MIHIPEEEVYLKQIHIPAIGGTYEWKTWYGSPRITVKGTCTAEYMDEIVQFEFEYTGKPNEHESDFRKYLRTNAYYEIQEQRKEISDGYTLKRLVHKLKS